MHWVDRHRNAIAGVLSVAGMLASGPAGWILLGAGLAFTALDMVHAYQEGDTVSWMMDAASLGTAGFATGFKVAGQAIVNGIKAGRTAKAAVDTVNGYERAEKLWDSGGLALSAVSAGMAEATNLEDSRAGSPGKCYSHDVGHWFPCPVAPPPDPNDAKYCNGNDLAKPSCWAPVPEASAKGPGRPGQHHGGGGSNNYQTWMNDYTDALKWEPHSQGNVDGNEITHVPGKNLYYY